MSCTTGCPSGGHLTWGECLRAKSLQVSPAINDNYSTAQRSLDKDLDHYESAKRQGLSPAGTSRNKVDAAFREADTT